MKKILLAILIILFTVSIVSATHLTCDPQSAAHVTKYRITLNGETLAADIEAVGENQVRLIYNIDHLKDGKHIVSGQAGNDKGEWSPPSNVLEFYRGVPTPQNIGLYCVTEEPARLSQEGWKINHVSSEESEMPGRLAIDGNVDTLWHTPWLTNDSNTKHPHEIQIDLGKEYQVQGLWYLSRQDSSWNGTIQSFVIYVSMDGKDWTEVVSGAFAKIKEEQFIGFVSVSARYISLVCLSEVNGKEWATVAEINVWGY